MPVAKAANPRRGLKQILRLLGEGTQTPVAKAANPRRGLKHNEPEKAHVPWIFQLAKAANPRRGLKPGGDRRESHQTHRVAKAANPRRGLKLCPARRNLFL